MTTPDRCRSFAGTALAIVLGFASSSGVAEAGCPLVPRAECGEFTKAKMSIETRGSVVWRASDGPEATLEDFGDPEAVSHYFFCAWDENGLLIAADIAPGVECSGESCWCSIDAGLRYKDPDGANSDIRKLEIVRDGDGHAKARADVFVVGGINLPVLGDLLVQLTRSDSETCFESLILAEDFLRNDRGASVAFSDREADEGDAEPAW